MVRNTFFLTSFPSCSRNFNFWVLFYFFCAAKRFNLMVYFFLFCNPFFSWLRMSELWSVFWFFFNLFEGLWRFPDCLLDFSLWLLFLFLFFFFLFLLLHNWNFRLRKEWFRRHVISIHHGRKRRWHHPFFSCISIWHIRHIRWPWKITIRWWRHIWHSIWWRIGGHILRERSRRFRIRLLLLNALIFI